MQKQLPALFAFVVGIVLAVLRAFFLVDAVEPDTGLIRRGNPLVFVPAVIAILCGVLLLYTALRYKHPKRAARQEETRFWSIFEIGAALFLAIFGGYQVFLSFEGEHFRLIIGGLAFASVASYLYTGRKIMQGEPCLSGANGVWASLPVFFFCSVMIMYFLEYAGQPGVSLYIYGVLSIIFAALSQYRISGFFFRSGKHQLAQFYTLTALFLSMLTAGGFFLASLLSPELHPYAQISVPNLFLFGFILLHMSSVAAGLSSEMYDFGLPPAPKPKEEELPEIRSVDEIILEYLTEEVPEEAPKASEDSKPLFENTEVSEEE